MFVCVFVCACVYVCVCVCVYVCVCVCVCVCVGGGVYKILIEMFRSYLCLHIYAHPDDELDRTVGGRLS